jgi:hypothetical protein
MWLNGMMSPSVDFKDVVFNIGETFFRVGRDGIVRESLQFDKSESLLLLDPCQMLHGSQDIPCRMLIIFSSPSCLSGQANKPNLAEISKTSETYVLQAPTEDETQKLYPNMDPRRLESFSYWKNGVRYCVLRWFSYKDSQIEAKIMESFTHTSRQDLWDWICFSRERVSRDSRLPFRLCIVENSPGGWCVTGFISKRLEYRVFTWASAIVTFEKMRIGNMLDYGLFKGAKGMLFEQFVFHHLGLGHPLTVATSRGDVIFNFNPLCLTDQCNAVVQVIPGRVHKIDHESFG